MVYKIMNINSIDKEMTQKYFPMLSEMRRQKISEMKTARERAITFCSEILARQCLSELFDSPEFSFSVLCNPDSKSILGNFNGSICIVTNGDYVACAADVCKVGISLKGFEAFSFQEAQKIFTDSEIRYIFSDSTYSFSQIVNMSQISEAAVCEKFAVMSALKEAQFKASGRGIRENSQKTEFTVSGNTAVCSDSNYKVEELKKDDLSGLIVGVVVKISQ
ncbi:MAG: 4'-phosphopantetheinyl transferase superfamily protein [Clostridia bacterium]|nr:4'-phosphopantetheinyl transferase superfamily protein [Clostridia bacterium]